MFGKSGMFLVVLALSALLSACGNQSSSGGAAGDPSVQSGASMPAGVPHSVVHVQAEQQECLGVVVGPSTVLTAAQCVRSATTARGCDSNIGVRTQNGDVGSVSQCHLPTSFGVGASGEESLGVAALTLKDMIFGEVAGLGNGDLTQSRLWALETSDGAVLSARAVRLVSGAAVGVGYESGWSPFAAMSGFSEGAKGNPVRTGAPIDAQDTLEPVVLARYALGSPVFDSNGKVQGVVVADSYRGPGFHKLGTDGRIRLAMSALCGASAAAGCRSVRGLRAVALGGLLAKEMSQYRDSLETWSESVGADAAFQWDFWEKKESAAGYTSFAVPSCVNEEAVELLEADPSLFWESPRLWIAFDRSGERLTLPPVRLAGGAARISLANGVDVSGDGRASPGVRVRVEATGFGPNQTREISIPFCR